MKKVKIKERFENAVDAFFDDEKLSKNNTLSYANHSALIQTQINEIFAGGKKNLRKLLKQVLLFFPGVFFLYFATFGTLNLYFRHNSLSGFNILSILLGITATLLGIGNWKDPKHFVLPLSVISLVAVIYSAANLLFDISDQGLIILVMYFFPLALILPFLAKGLVDKTGKDFD